MSRTWVTRASFTWAAPALGLLLLFAAAARADTVVAIVSEASAPEFASAARAFAARTSPHRLVFRSTPQVARMGDAELQALLAAADVLVLAAVFGEDAVRLRPLLHGVRARTVLPLHGDAGFMRHARIDGRAAFTDLPPDAAARRLRELAGRPSGPEAPASEQSPEELLAQARRYRDGRGVGNMVALLRFVLAQPEARPSIPPPRSGTAVRYLDANGRPQQTPSAAGPAVVIVDYNSGDGEGDASVRSALCRALAARGLACLSVLSRWGKASIEALRALLAAERSKALSIRAIVMLQDFVIGGGAGAEEAAGLLRDLDVPVLKAVRMADRSTGAWSVSEDGLPDDSVHYRLAMPELQGISQPFVVAAAGPTRVEPTCGLEVSPPVAVMPEVEAMASRIARLSALRTKSNADKRVAIIYYNHPPGRHNIGADNLDVPASLLSILAHLRAAGYDTGELPASAANLLGKLQARGVNLPEDGEALQAMAGRVARVAPADYGGYFARLPAQAQANVRDGPLSALRLAAEQAIKTGERELASERVERVLADVRHLLEGVIHPAREHALSTLDRLADRYGAWLDGQPEASAEVTRLSSQLAGFGIEGLGGWGPPPGRIMTHAGELVIPGLSFGKVFIGPQPPRGWELNEELLHANLAFPPPHQYLAFYEYLRRVWRADVLIHVGRHSTYEFLPGRRAGVGVDDFSRIVLGDLPSVYLYIVDGVGEGIQAKRRGQAIIIDHLTPSLSTTPLYDDLLSLRQLVESYEAGAGIKGHAGARALSEIRDTIERLNMRDELEASMRPELQARGIGFDQADGELLVHEVGHYLTKLQERFMPHGLHVFGKSWSHEAIERMVQSMAGDRKPDASWRKALLTSPQREAQALLSALEGRFVPPGPGNDPVRTPEVLPTGRSFHALDASVLPTKLGYKLGAELAARARKDAPGTSEGAEAVVLWASDTVRDEGAMVGFGMDMLGIAPRWNSRGIVQGLKRLPLVGGRVRRDTTFIASGLFRDLYPPLCDYLDRAVLLAIDGSSQHIVSHHPELRDALEATMAPLGDARAPGNERPSHNQVAAHWIQTTKELLAAGTPKEAAGRLAAARVFGDAPGTYGAGINRLAERSGAWQARSELVKTYVRRVGHAYGGGRSGAPAHAVLRAMLARTEHTYLGRASNLYGILDNNDVFDYLGGLGMAVEQARGTPPKAHVVQHADPKATRVEPLPSALLQELRGRHLNPTYLKGLMAHGYAGARTMGSGFVENLWGWQITSPHIVRSWVWDEVKAVYLDDKYAIGVSKFLAQDDNVHVRTNVQAILLVAAHKGFWQADESALRALSESFARAVVEHGLPGSGHTRPDHPMLADVLRRLPDELAQALRARLDAALGRSARALVSELEHAHPANRQGEQTAAEPTSAAAAATPPWPRGMTVALAALGLVGLGFVLERRKRM